MQRSFGVHILPLTEYTAADLSENYDVDIIKMVNTEPDMEKPRPYCKAETNKYLREKIFILLNIVVSIYYLYTSV